MFKELEPEDLLKFGFIPEFIGRLPVLATLEELNAAFTRSKFRQNIVRAYYQSALLIGYLADTYGFDKIVEMAIVDPTAGGNPIQFTQKQYKALARKCVTGDL